MLVCFMPSLTLNLLFKFLITPTMQQFQTKFNGQRQENIYLHHNMPKVCVCTYEKAESVSLGADVLEDVLGGEVIVSHVPTNFTLIQRGVVLSGVVDLGDELKTCK